MSEPQLVTGAFWFDRYSERLFDQGGNLTFWQKKIGVLLRTWKCNFSNKEIVEKSVLNLANAKNACFLTLFCIIALK